MLSDVGLRGGALPRSLPRSLMQPFPPSPLLALSYRARWERSLGGSAPQTATLVPFSLSDKGMGGGALAGRFLALFHALFHALSHALSYTLRSLSLLSQWWSPGWGSAPQTATLVPYLLSDTGLCGGALPGRFLALFPALLHALFPALSYGPSLPLFRLLPASLPSHFPAYLRS